MNKLVQKINSDIISEAIENFEKEIDFEFIPVIAKKSSSVDHVHWMISLVLLVLFVGLIDYFFENSYESKIVYFLAAPPIVIVLGVLLSRSNAIVRLFISRPERHRQVHEKAERIFFKKKLHQSKSHNAVLLFISVLERQIVLLPDPQSNIENMKQINEKILNLLQKSFKKDEFQQGILSVIELLRTELIHKHKKTAETPNQFSNTLIWWKD